MSALPGLAVGVALVALGFAFRFVFDHAGDPCLLGAFAGLDLGGGCSLGCGMTFCGFGLGACLASLSGSAAVFAAR